MKKTILKFKKVAVAVMAMVLAVAPMANTAQAANFHDVGPNLSWAADAISTVSSLGIMTGDLSGNFNPNASIDMFEMVRIFARMSGFNPANHTPAQVTYYNNVFESRRALIEGFQNNFSTWNATMNREIAFLLYRGILTAADLNNFVVMQGNTQARPSLTREQAAVFLVRFMGHTSQAASVSGVPLFSDDNLITPAARPSVYYLRSLGILNGSGGAVNPQGDVNRAAMAMLVDATLHEINSPLLTGGHPGSNSTSNNNTNNNQNNQNNQGVEAVTGTITNTFPSLRSVLVSSNDTAHNNRVFALSQNALITVGGNNANFAALAPGMTFTAILSGTEIVSITATTATASNNNNQTNNNQAPTPEQMRTVDGTVARVNAANRTIGIETRHLNPRGDIITETRDYTITNNATITRAGADVNFSTIVVGDLIVAQVYGSTAYIVEVEERITQMSGRLIEKDFSASSTFPTITLEDTNGNTRSFTVNSQTTITRGNQANINSRQLRIGDTINLTADHGRATQIQAQPGAARSTMDVYVRDIFITSRGQNFITVSSGMGANSTEYTFLLVDGHVDAFELTLGSRIRLWFDSQEVIGVHLLQGQSNVNFTGQLMNVTGGQLVVRDSNFQTRTFIFDNNTVFVNSVTGQIISLSQLQLGMNLQIVSAANQTNRAVSVTVLGN